MAGVSLLPAELGAGSHHFVKHVDNYAMEVEFFFLAKLEKFLYY